MQLSPAWQAVNSALCSDIERAPDPSMMEVCIDAKGAQRRGYLEEFIGEVTSGPSCALGVLIREKLWGRDRSSEGTHGE